MTTVAASTGDEGGNKQEQVLNDLASFYFSIAQLDFTIEDTDVENQAAEEEARLAAAKKKEEEAAATPVQRNIFIGNTDKSVRRRPGSRPNQKSNSSTTAAAASSNSSNMGMGMGMGGLQPIGEEPTERKTRRRPTSNMNANTTTSNERNLPPPPPPGRSKSTDLDLMGIDTSQSSRRPPRRSGSGDGLGIGIGDSTHSSSGGRTAPRRSRSGENLSGSNHSRNYDDKEEEEEEDNNDTDQNQNNNSRHLRRMSRRRQSQDHIEIQIKELQQEADNYDTTAAGAADDFYNNEDDNNNEQDPHQNQQDNQNQNSVKMLDGVAPLNDTQVDATNKALKRMTSKTSSSTSVAATGDLAKLRAATQKSNSSGGSSGRSSRRAQSQSQSKRFGSHSKWGALKGGMDFISHTKAKVDHDGKSSSGGSSSGGSGSGSGRSGSRRGGERGNGEHPRRSNRRGERSSSDRGDRDRGASRRSSPKSLRSPRSLRSGSGSGNRNRNGGHGRPRSRSPVPNNNSETGAPASRRRDGESSSTGHRRGPRSTSTSQNNSGNSNSLTTSRPRSKRIARRSKDSKWTGVKGGMDFIQKTKSQSQATNRSRSLDRLKQQKQQQNLEIKCEHRNTEPTGDGLSSIPKSEQEDYSPLPTNTSANIVEPTTSTTKESTVSSKKSGGGGATSRFKKLLTKSKDKESATTAAAATNAASSEITKSNASAELTAQDIGGDNVVDPATVITPEIAQTTSKVSASSSKSSSLTQKSKQGASKMFKKLLSKSSSQKSTSAGHENSNSSGNGGDEGGDDTLKSAGITSQELSLEETKADEEEVAEPGTNGNLEGFSWERTKPKVKQTLPSVNETSTSETDTGSNSEPTTTATKKPSSAMFKNLLSTHGKSSSRSKNKKEGADESESLSQEFDLGSDARKKKPGSYKWSGIKGGMDFSNRLIAKTSDKKKPSSASKTNDPIAETIVGGAVDNKTSNITTTSSSALSGSKWSGLKGGMDFTNRLIAKTSDKEKKSKREADVIAVDKEVGEATDEPSSFKKGSKWNLASKLGSKKEKEVPTDYGLMMSISSFSPDAIEGLADFAAPETVEEGDEEAPDSDEPISDLEDEANDEAPLPLQEDVPSSQLDAFAMISEEQSKDAFALFGGDDSVKDAPVISTTPPADRRQMFSNLTEPSMRFDCDAKQETVMNRSHPNSHPDMVEEGDEEKENSEHDEAGPSLLKRATAIEDDEDDESIVLDGMEDESTLKQNDTSAKSATSGALAMISSGRTKTSNGDVDLEDVNQASDYQEAREDEANQAEDDVQDVAATKKSEKEQGAKEASTNHSSDPLRRKKSGRRRKDSKWTGLKGGLEFTNRLYAVTGQSKSKSEGKSKWDLSKLKKEDDQPANTEKVVDSKARPDEDNTQDLVSEQKTNPFALLNVIINSASDKTDINRRPLLSSLAKPSMRFDFYSKNEKFKARTQPHNDIVEEEEEEEEDVIEEEEEDTDDEEVLEDNHSVSSQEDNVVVSSAGEGEGDILFLSPLKCMQLTIGSSMCDDDGLSVTIHGLSDDNYTNMEEEENDMRVHHMSNTGVQFDHEYRSQQQQRKKTPGKMQQMALPNVVTPDIVSRDTADNGTVAVHQAATVQGKNVVIAASRGNKAEDALACHVDEIEQLIKKQANQIQMDLQAEYDRLKREIEESRARAAIAREAVRNMQQQIQKQRHHYGAVERRKQLSLKDMERQNIVLKKVPH